MKPTLGRIVLFQRPPYAEGMRAPPPKECPAIITEVFPGALATTQPDKEIAYTIQLTVFDPNKEMPERRTPTAYDPDGVIPNSWRWPPREG